MRTSPDLNGNAGQSQQSDMIKNIHEMKCKSFYFTVSFWHKRTDTFKQQQQKCCEQNYNKTESQSHVLSSNADTCMFHKITLK